MNAFYVRFHIFCNEMIEIGSKIKKKREKSKLKTVSLHSFRKDRYEFENEK